MIKSKEDTEVLHPTSFRLTAAAVYAIAKGCEIFRMSRGEFVEALAKAAVSGKKTEFATERAKITIASELR
jgi:hypothetical protein